MSLDLDNRQQAMLLEMGIKLWQPAPESASFGASDDTANAGTPSAGSTARMGQPTAPRASVPDATGLTRAGTLNSGASAPSGSSGAPSKRATPAPQRTASPSAASLGPDQEPSWQWGRPLLLYPGDAAQKRTAIRWLLLTEMPADITQPLDDEAGQLLDNMLRAAGMHQDASVKLVPAQRVRSGASVESGDGGQGGDWQASLAALIEAEQPHVVLVMGRILGQALLPSPEPFAKRRGQALQLHGCPALMSSDASMLLRNMPDKANAWADLCLARAMALQRGA